MTTLHVPDYLASTIRHNAKEYGYASSSAYLKDLALADERRRAGARVAALIQEGRDSGTVADTDAMFEELHVFAKSVAAKAKARK